ncbi:toxin-coregulated pilus methyl-accepting chemotaxis protein TcpI [Aliivibrio fischeri]|uniref:toxin-coregulated pilus methyl-accepting chemotaxis protein TcpI n=1 Tax=Aliivibrio fischeri TaxID=668 RepID=UPI0012DA5869|nr:toxin-coregulated pilus methyl-accepting chemotaxis protein TcpI [Aliivibrio fischeri]MUJ28714.1 toxin-coregulated pilus methyl-accepting chemotaxis protein TcpI [Aliivibrio fischeri]MUK69702.1 toxin-coregulated pilus methyl-accepting chemotaxis protein TcpI [Aliivibrio fischeri]MUK72236.1 toxin-coregulated pilus methyl-accepting chemotaxis protein TcpI [Aliivibrio fischeri]
MIKKITLIFCLVILITLALTLIASGSFLKTYKESNMTHASKIALNVTQANFNAAINGLYGSIKSLSAALELNPNQPFDEKLILGNIQNIVESNDAYRNVILANLNGDVFSVSANGWNKKFNAIKGNREWFNSIILDKKEANISAPYRSNTGNYEITASAPLLFNNQIVGVIAVGVNLNALIPNSGIEFALTTQSGHIVAIDNNSPDWLNKNLFEIRPEYKGVTDKPMFIDAGDNEYFSLTRLPLSHDLIGYVFTNQTSTFENAQNIRTALISVLVILGLVLTLAQFIVVRKELSQIPNVVSNIQLMASGDFTNLSIPKTGNEIDLITESLESLQSRISGVMTTTNTIMYKLSEHQEQISEVTNNNVTRSESELQHIDQVAAAITEMATTANDIAANALSAEGETSTTLVLSSDSLKTLQESSSIVDRVSSSVKESSCIIEELKILSDNISSVVDVIGNISDQTNLLALNAAIEAARAGEQGRGFAVVADEVRALAVKTQDSTANIQTIIATLQTEATKAVDAMENNLQLTNDLAKISDKIEDAFNNISEKVTLLVDINSSVATASEEQSIVNQNIAHNVEDIKNMVVDNLSGVTQAIDSNSEMVALVEELKAEVSFFKVS